MEKTITTAAVLYHPNNTTRGTSWTGGVAARVFVFVFVFVFVAGTGRRFGLGFGIGTRRFVVGTGRIDAAATRASWDNYSARGNP